MGNGDARAMLGILAALVDAFPKCHGPLVLERLDDNGYWYATRGERGCGQTATHYVHVCDWTEWFCDECAPRMRRRAEAARRLGRKFYEPIEPRERKIAPAIRAALVALREHAGG